nr:unnamed protein product [Callosobruchus analis]
MDDFTIRQSLFLCSILGCNPTVPFGKIQLLLTTGTVSSAVVVGLLLFLQIIFPGDDTMNMEVLRMLNREIEAMFDISDESIIARKVIKLIEHHDFMLRNSISFAIIRDLDVVAMTLIEFFGAFFIPAQLCINQWYEHPQYYRHISMIIARDSLGITMNAGGIVRLDLETALNMITKVVLMVNKRKEMQEIFKYMNTVFWKIEDVADEKERTAYKKILLSGRFTLHLWSVVFVVWLCCVCRTNSLPLKCYQPKWAPLYSIIALQDLTFILLMLNQELKAMFDTSDEDIIARKVIKLIEHHDFMLRCLSVCRKSISFATIRDLDVVASTLIEFFGAFFIPAQLCINQAEEIKYSAYFSKWYEHPLYYRHISMIIARDSLGITMNAGGIVRLDLETALNVSIFSFLYCIGGDG